MKKAVVIVNGITFPFYLVDHAISWAKQEKASLHALFLTSGKEVQEGYAFPSDINLAETLTDRHDVAKDNNAILHDQMRLFTDMAKTEGITGSTELLNHPTLEQVLEKINQAPLLFIAPGYGDTAQLAITRFRLQELIDQALCPVEIIQDKSSSL